MASRSPSTSSRPSRLSAPSQRHCSSSLTLRCRRWKPSISLSPWSWPHECTRDRRPTPAHQRSRAGTRDPEGARRQRRRARGPHGRARAAEGPAGRARGSGNGASSLESRVRGGRAGPPLLASSLHRVPSLGTVNVELDRSMKLKVGDTEVARIGLGTNRLRNTPANVAFVKEAIAAGVGMIDTAHTYTGGESEQTNGMALPRETHHCVVATESGGGGGSRRGRPGNPHAAIGESPPPPRTPTSALY